MSVPTRPYLEPTEAQFTTQVLDALQWFDWRAVHFRPARTTHGWRTALQGARGWPDIFAVRGTRSLAAELKVGKRKTDPHQEAWLAALEQAGVEVFVWRPPLDPIIEIIR